MKACVLAKKQMTWTLPCVIYLYGNTDLFASVPFLVRREYITLIWLMGYHIE